MREKFNLNQLEIFFKEQIKNMINETTEENLSITLKDMLEVDQQIKKFEMTKEEFENFERFSNLVKQLAVDLENIQNKKIQTLALYLNKKL